MSKQLTGSCLCGGFKYMVKNPLKMLSNCHCSMCRNSLGAAFLSAFLVPKDDLILLETSTMASHKSSENVIRHFCKRCGCSTHCEDHNFSTVPILLSAGTLDCDPGINVSCEVFTKYKTQWQALCEGVPHSEEIEAFAELLKKF